MIHNQPPWEELNMAIIGIDLGTTNSIVTAFQNGACVLIPNQHGEYLTPSVVGLDERGALLVGKLAKERLITAPHLTTALFKRNMGTKTKAQLGTKSFLPEELSSFVLRQLIEDAKRFLDAPIEEVVISVPAYFDAKQRAATKRAGFLAGAKVERLVNEPSAAAIACKQEGEDDTFLIFDFGGGTLDVSIVEVFDNVVNICAIAGDNRLGGREFDHVIFEAICAENQIDRNALSRQERETLLRLAEQAKTELQNRQEVQIKGTIQNRTVEMHLTDETLANLSGEIFARIKRPIQAAINDSGLQASDISRCILVGGSCHMKIVQEFLSLLLRVPVQPGKDMDHVVAEGLGIFVGIKQRDSEVRDMVLTDICPFSLNTGVYNAANPNKTLAQTMIPRNSILPRRVTESLCTVDLGQTEINVTVTQGEQMYEEENTLLGSLTIRVPKNMKEHEHIEITFYYDINAILVVNVRVVSTGAEHSLVLTGDGLELSGKELEHALRELQNMKFRSFHNQRFAFLQERAKRIYAEGNTALQAHMLQLIIELEQLERTGIIGGIRKQNAILDEFEAYLEQMEATLDNPDIFQDFSEFTFGEDSDD